MAAAKYSCACYRIGFGVVAHAEELGYRPIVWLTDLRKAKVAYNKYLITEATKRLQQRLNYTACIRHKTVKVREYQGYANILSIWLLRSVKEE